VTHKLKPESTYSQGNTLDAFTTLAAKTNMSIAPPGGPRGGTLDLGAASNSTGTGSNATITTAGTPSSTSSIVKFTGAAAAVAVDMVKGLVGVGAVLALL